MIAHPILKWIVLFVAATVCHWGGTSFFSLGGFQVNLMLVFALSFCNILQPKMGYPTVFLCGLFLDFFGTKLFGNNAFSFTAAACIFYALKGRFDFEAFIPQCLTVFFLTCFVSVLNSILLRWFTSSSLWPGFFSLLGGAVIGALAAPVIFWGMHSWWVGTNSNRQ